MLVAWLRTQYSFPNPLEIRLIDKQRIVDADGTKCAMRWWQSDRQGNPIVGEIAVGSFRTNLRREGPTVAYPTVVAAIGRVVKRYFQIVRNLSIRETSVAAWGDKLLAKYSEFRRTEEENRT
jgi:hypothetical protein